MSNTPYFSCKAMPCQRCGNGYIYKNPNGGYFCSECGDDDSEFLELKAKTETILAILEKDFKIEVTTRTDRSK